MRAIETKLPGAVIFEPDVFGDDRGYFLETWNRERYANAGLNVDFVQDNMSFSRKGILRGLHFQNPGAQGKLVSVPMGEVYDVAVDVRSGSPTFGQWVGVELSATNKRQFYIPPGFAHGFCVTSDTALFFYKCTELYNNKAESSILWNDPEIGVKWPISEPLLSAKDQNAPRLSQLPTSRFSF